jgi:hypothetical protein
MKTTMKTKLFLSMLTIAIGFTACKKESPEPISGCTDSIALNFDPLATIDDSSCIYNTIISGTIIELDAQAATFIPNPPPAPPTITGDYTKFSFSEGGIVEGDNWDIAFRNTSIIVNGGMASDASQPNRTGDGGIYLISGTMEDITSVVEAYLQGDGETGTAIIDDMGQMQMGWCVYDHATNVISPIAGEILVVRTHDNKYAKVEILNFYDSPMTNPYGGFYTFNYVYQSEAEVTTF